MQGGMIARTMKVSTESSYQQAGILKVSTESAAGKEQVASQGADWTYTCPMDCNMPHTLTTTRFFTGILTETGLRLPEENSRYKQQQQANCS